MNPPAKAKPEHPAPNFGKNVIILDPAMPKAEIQSKVDAIFKQQESNQFGNSRYAILLKPGHYHNTIKVGFYTQVLGLGQTPDAVNLHGALQVDATWYGGDATQNFWRSAENLAIYPSNGTMQWAVSQASPIRRLHVHGNMVLDHDEGWSSGGFMADTLVDGDVDSGTQQQWLSRNSNWTAWKGHNWNIVFVGSPHAPDDDNWKKDGYTRVKETPVIREKPFLTLDNHGQYIVFVPAIRHNSQNISWGNNPDSYATQGEFAPLSQFYIAKAEQDDATSINKALTQGKHLLLTPGIYDLNDTLRISKANTVVLGLGLATLRPTTGLPAMTVADVDGVKLAGILFDAGAKNSSVLLQVGQATSHLHHADNPSSLHDLFFRVGGAGVGNASTSLEINSNDVIGDNFWLWRADHGTGTGWQINRTQHGLVVNGNRLTIYGLAVEHYHQAQTVWNGDNGAVYFYQSEIPYEVPDQASWMDGGKQGFSSYQVSTHVTHHLANGVGIYCYFIGNPKVKLHSAIEAPLEKASIHFNHVVTVALGGEGEISHVINTQGQAANKKQNLAHIATIP